MPPHLFSSPFRATTAWLLVPLLGLGLNSCGTNSQADTAPPTEQLTLPVARLQARDTTLLHDYVADIQAVRNVEIRARVAGFLEQIYVDEGQTVTKGQLLFRINDAEYKTRLARARATLSSATAQARIAGLELDRVRLLTQKKIITDTELDVAQAKLHAAQARIEEARSAAANAALQLSYTLIRAPFAGTINREQLKVGSLVSDGTLLTTVSDTRELFAYFNVSEAEYLEYAKSRPAPGSPENNVRLVLADGSLYAAPGKIETVEGQFQASTGSIAFRARFANPRQLLKHGATGKVRLGNPVPDALLVPQKAVFEVQDKNYVYVVNRQGVVRRKNFVPQARLAAFYVVEKGLQAGDQVVCEGIQDLRDGARITARPVTLQSLLASAD
ncbi:efflux RND transporter periplasmic adaptor subunit [Hymenobacter aquaticus]|uniref:Efflux RND transporter periplasmic adaptor subunit n=1 Tax=Hymenobacter aquaticus TaxID=1867101 RepID=A0A4Z0Q599_9BACT|nr:efflux RND transporter periplasmic adaptor subunit [Hymenobacter aquaticus]TGE25258.1 efflux RND transporter periplasmic adaptor subunit [Hymenobacter aquaticus]